MKLEERVSQFYDHLNPNDLMIWRYINEHRGECCNLSIEALASNCNVSRSTVMRFAQKLELRGYGELKAFLRWEYGDFQDNDQNLAEQVCDSVVQTIERFRNMDCDAIFKRFYEANRIFVYGTGSVQRAAALEFKRIFLNVGMVVDHISGESELLRTIPLMSDQDVVFIISKSGESPVIKKAMMALRSRGIQVVSITNSGNNTLANMSDFNLFISFDTYEVTENLKYDLATQVFVAIQILCVKFIQYIQKYRQQ